MEVYLVKHYQKTKNARNKIIYTYYYNLLSLNKLISHQADNGIIHFDIKENNIIYDLKNHSPIIIDFNISFNIKDAKDKNRQKEIFYTNDFYFYWGIDIFIISNIINGQTDINSFATKEKITKFIDDFFEDFTKHIKILGVTKIIDDNEIKINRDKFVNYFVEKYSQFPLKKMLDDLTEPKIIKTWDNYSLALTYIKILSVLPKGILNETEEQKIKSIVFSLPHERPSAQETLDIFFQNNSDDFML